MQDRRRAHQAVFREQIVRHPLLFSGCVRRKSRSVVASHSEAEQKARYMTTDPAPAFSLKLSTQELKAKLLDDSLSLFQRYRAMFALRDKGDEEAILVSTLASQSALCMVVTIVFEITVDQALAEGFGDKSAVFRHEIAYVFGQVQHQASVPSLVKVSISALS